MAHPTCRICGKELEDWVGNVMVNSNYGELHEIRDVEVVCKPCTIAMDEASQGTRWHNLWELQWLKDKQSLFDYAIDNVLDNILAFPEREKALGVFTWTRPAIGKLLRLIAMRLDVEIDEEWHGSVWANRTRSR